MSELKECPVMDKDTIDCATPDVMLSCLARCIRAQAATCPHRRVVDLEELARAYRLDYCDRGHYDCDTCVAHNDCSEERVYNFIRNWRKP